MNNDFNLNELDIKELKKINKYNSKTIKKIKNGYPIQYIIGNVDFCGYKINVNKNTLIPRFETETLIEKTLDYCKRLNKESLNILDLCTGSGCIGITLKKELTKSNVIISDISSKALKVAKKNIKENDVNIKAIKSDLFNNIPNIKFDLIISNPPYIPNDEILPKNVLKEPHKALYGGITGTEIIERILKEIKDYLNDKYIIVLEIHENSKNQLIELIKKYFSSDTNYKFETDLNNKIRYLFIYNV